MFESSDYHRAWGEVFAHPSCIGDRNGRLLWLNEALADTLADNDLCRLDGSDLVFLDDNQHTRFLEFLAGLDSSPKAFLARNGKDQNHLILRCEVLRPTHCPEAVAFMFFDSRRKPVYVWSDFGAVFDLTARESVIAQRLVDGVGLSDLAAQLGITDETIKTHLRRIYAKIGACSREQFYVKLLPFRVV